MASSTDFKKCTGNAALYLTIDRLRAPTFLRRNVKKALDQHDHTLRAAKLSTNANLCETASAGACGLPDDETVAALSESRKPLLKIDVKHILPTGRAGANTNPSMLKTRTYAAPCKLVCRIYRLSAKAWDAIYTEISSATAQAWRTTDGEDCISVSMDTPVYVTADQLRVPVPVLQEKAYKLLMANAYRMTISMMFEGHTDMKELLSIINPQDISVPESAGKLHARMDTLLQTSKDGIRAPLSFTAAGKSYPLGFDMAVDAGWNVSEEDPAQHFNRLLRSVRGERQSTPMSSTPSSPRSTGLAYRFGDQMQSAAIKVEGFQCILCNGRDYHTFDRLYHHFKTGHDMFTFKLERTGSDAPASLQGRFKIEMDISDKYSDSRASNSVADPREINWVTPLEPFDLKAYLKGDESWIKTGLGMKKKCHFAPRIAPLPHATVEPKRPIEVADMPMVEKKKYRVPKAPRGLRFYRTDSKRPLEEGEYLSESDDDISEDWLKLRRNLATKDAEVATPAKVFMMRWDDYMQDEQLCGDVHLGEAVVRFARKYRTWLTTRERMGNEFLRKTSELHKDKIICSEVFEACVDLIEGNGVMMDAFAAPAGTRKRRRNPSESKPNELSSRERDHRTKRKYIPGGPGGGGKWFDVPEDDKRPRRKKARPMLSGDGSMCLREGAHAPRPPSNSGSESSWVEQVGRDSTTKPPLQDDSPQQSTVAFQGGCTCGKVVDDDVAAIACANLDCRRQEYHMSCVGLTSRRPNWLCVECQGE